MQAKKFIEIESINNFKNKIERLTNGFEEFQYTMGTDYQYYSSNMNRGYSSEELSAEVLKKLKSYVTDDDIRAIVTTVPNLFKQSQLEATQKAARSAGFDYCELLQESIAASLAYGIEAEERTGYWLVFDFGKDSFHVDLMCTEKDVIKIVDTEFDAYLSSMDIDNATIDHILIPKLAEQNYLEDTLSDKSTKDLLRKALRGYAVKVKTVFSSQESYYDFVEEDVGEDDYGEDIERDISISLVEYEKVVSPIFQQTIDKTNELLKRNGFPPNSFEKIILVGNITLQQTLRNMLRPQTSPNLDTSIDPTIAIVKGAAKFTLTRDVPSVKWVSPYK